MASGTIQNNQMRFDYVTFNLSELTGTRGYFSKETQKTHEGEMLVGFCLVSTGVEDASYYQVQPILLANDNKTVYLTYNKSSDVTRNRDVAMRLIFTKQSEFV